MKLRLIQAGYETFTGQMGAVFFEDGLSTGDVSEMDAVRMSAVFQCEWENGDSSSVANWLIERKDDPAPDVLNVEPVTQDTPATKAPEGEAWTEAELAAIADQQGISGLRAIGDKLGVKEKSIRGLIDGILAKNPQ